MEKQNKIKAEGMSRQAAAENEHVAVRSSNGGREITREVVFRRITMRQMRILGL